MSVLKTYGADIGFKPSKTYQLINGRIEGKIDGLKAAAQAVELALNTERFAFPVYSLSLIHILYLPLQKKENRLHHILHPATVPIPGHYPS